MDGVWREKTYLAFPGAHPAPMPKKFKSKSFSLGERSSWKMGAVGEKGQDPSKPGCVSGEAALL